MENRLKWVIISQSVAILGAGLVFPFYILFIKEVGSTFSQFGISYGLFTISSALVHQWIGSHSDRVGRKLYLVLYAWGTGSIFLLFPIVTSIWQVYVLQIFLGFLGAMQKTSEKALIADLTNGETRGKQIGVYHFWTALFSGIAIMGGGYLIDFLTIEYIFYIGSMILFGSGFLILKIKEHKKEPL
ncbi:MFS transporter [Caldalkalibacillus mannanilyticus]|uniref:MFS transporter n=1 Tax=Caldalkalibacillus mannanilyticus TaxID=1418 RepID=UPI000558A81F|nr:MFS transporter [Caldalkalibacillus mannanilyticus]